jgi:hypothetical protein
MNLSVTAGSQRPIGLDSAPIYNVPYDRSSGTTGCWPGSRLRHAGQLSKDFSPISARACMVVLNGSACPSLWWETVEAGEHVSMRWTARSLSMRAKEIELWTIGARPTGATSPGAGTFSPEMILWCERFQGVDHLVIGRCPRARPDDWHVFAGPRASDQLRRAAVRVF